MNREKLLEKLRLTPEGAGVYLMRDMSGAVIYIGKAKNLKRRLSNYFINKVHNEKTTAMIEKIADFEYFVVKTENDALGLEANLINKHKPHYNILLKDDKSFQYIKICDDKFPYLVITRKVDKRGKYFGPYYNGIWAREVLNLIQALLRVRTCKKMPKSACLNYQIGRCSAPCENKISGEDYAKIIDNVKKFLRGESDFNAREILTQKMQIASELEQFELAIKYRTDLKFLDKLEERVITNIPRDLNLDVFGYFANASLFVASVINIRQGKMIGVQNFGFELVDEGDIEGVLENFVLQYYEKNPIREQIVAEFELENVAEILGTKVFNPKTSVKKQFLDTANANAKEYAEKSLEKIKFKTSFTSGACEELGVALGMAKVPHKIECYDISHLSGEDMVASMVVFVGGVAERKLYRKFNIKHGQGNNDFLSMREVLTRRLARIGDADVSFGAAPDLIVIDGGKGQLSAVSDLIEPHGIAVCSLAKQEEEIFLPSATESIKLSKRSFALKLLMRIRDEAHRFAITFNRSKRAVDKKRGRK
ncbi:MAG: excinuclease ABC subunit UvrC [Christensenellaceae bacterium]|jgi:excinuclease ABC subunit C|nr:excinuclease ABC subunit UvrC [Christensenellaceae bacterium]